MGFSSIPMQNNLTPVGPGGVVTTAGQGINALTKGNLENQILASQAPYAGYQAYGNAFKTMQEAQWMPLQQKMAALSNPMLWMMAKDNPALQGQLNQLISSSMGGIPSGNAMGGGMNLPQSGSTGGMPSNMPIPGQPNQAGGIVGMLKNSPIGQFMGNIFGKGQQTQLQPQSPNPMQQVGNSSNVMPGGSPADQPASQGTPLVPATEGGGGMAGAVAKFTAPMVQGPYGPAALIPDPMNPSHVIQVPTSRMSTQLQTQISAATRMLPEFSELPKLWGPFMDLKGYGNLVGAKIGNVISSSVSPQIMDQLKQFGITDQSKLPSQYTDAKMAAITSVEAYLKSIGVTPSVYAQKHIKEYIEPEFGESADGYQQRIQTETQRIVKDYVSQALNQIEQGYPTAPDQKNSSMGNYVSQNGQPVSMGIGVNNGNEGPSQGSKILDGIEYIKLNGKWHKTNG